MYKYFKKVKHDENIFLPTYAYKMLSHLNKKLPNAEFIFSDFDLLRNSISSEIGINAPTVSTKLEASEAAKDFQDYLVPRGTADIFFPTNFRLLSSMHRRITNKPSQVLKSYQFVEDFSDKNWVTTQSGYNPLKEDFANTAFFLSKNI